MAWLLTHLLSKYKDLSLITRTHEGAGLGGTYLQPPAGEAETGDC